MTQTQTSKSSRASGGKATIGRLFFLEASGGRILSVDPDGSDRKVIISGCRIPDGVVVDAEAGHIYWTNMGVPSQNDGSILIIPLCSMSPKFLNLLKRGHENASQGSLANPPPASTCA